MNCYGLGKQLQLICFSRKPVSKKDQNTKNKV